MKRNLWTVKVLLTNFYINLRVDDSVNINRLIYRGPSNALNAEYHDATSVSRLFIYVIKLGFVNLEASSLIKRAECLFKNLDLIAVLGNKSILEPRSLRCNILEGFKDLRGVPVLPLWLHCDVKLDIHIGRKVWIIRRIWIGWRRIRLWIGWFFLNSLLYLDSDNFHIFVLFDCFLHWGFFRNDFVQWILPPSILVLLISFIEISLEFFNCCI